VELSFIPKKQSSSNSCCPANMNDVLFNAPRVPLKVNQIACLEHDNANLYGEVIQLVPLRQLCWFRPMCLVISDLSDISGRISLSSLKDSSAPHFSLPEARLINLQSASDLLWATILFRPALDTEVISFLAQLQIKISFRYHVRYF